MQEVRVYAIDELSVSESELVDDYISKSNSSGVLTGVLGSSLSWNVKPLLLHQGRIFLLRFSDYSQPLAGTSFYDDLNRIYDSVSATRVCAFGTDDNLYWNRRPYYQSTLVDEIEEGGLSRDDKEQIAAQLISSVSSWVKSGLFHGHLSPGNVAIENGQIIIIDFCFGLFTLKNVRNDRSYAPELNQTSIIDIWAKEGSDSKFREAIDVYGLAYTLSELYSEDITQAQNNFLQRCFLRDVNLRPSISDFNSHFKSTKKTRTSKSISEKGKKLPASFEERSVEETLEWLKGTTRLGAETVGQIRELINTKKEKIDSSVEKTALVSGNIETVEKPFPKFKLASFKIDEFSIPSSALYALMALVFCLLLYFKSGFFTHESLDPKLFDKYWGSNVPSKMREVAIQAIENNDSEAELVILQDILFADKKIAGVRNDIVKIGFNSLWESDLSASDRREILRYSLKNLLPQDLRSARSLKRVHPALLMALMSNREILDEELDLDRIDDLSTLPEPFGSAFNALLDMGVSNCSSPDARALSSLLLGKLSKEILNSYFRNEEGIRRLAKLRILVLGGLKPIVLRESFEILRSSNDQVSKLISWFDEIDLVDWNEVPYDDRIQILTGVVPQSAIRKDFLFDLLKHPLRSLRVGAVEKITSNHFTQADSATIAYLASDKNNLLRSQSVFLVRAIALKKDIEQHGFLTRWFATLPDPTLVKDLLVIRNNISKADAFSTESARYLKSEKWTATSAELEILAQNPDSLVRALAYTRLDPESPEQKIILKKMIRLEPLESLRGQLKLQLELDVK